MEMLSFLGTPFIAAGVLVTIFLLLLILFCIGLLLGDYLQGNDTKRFTFDERMTVVTSVFLSSAFLILMRIILFSEVSDVEYRNLTDGMRGNDSKELMDTAKHLYKDGVIAVWEAEILLSLIEPAENHESLSKSDFTKFIEENGSLTEGSNRMNFVKVIETNIGEEE